MDIGVTYINMKSFKKGGGLNQDGIKSYTGNYSERDLLSNNDVVIANTDVTLEGDIIGSPALIPDAFMLKKTVCSHHVSVFRLHHGFNNKFIYYLLCLNKYKCEMKKYSRGTTVLMLDTKRIESVNLFVPTSITEQRKIARILSAVDVVTEKTEAAIEKYKAIKKGMMHDLFTRGIDLETGKLRPSYDQAPQLYKETELGWIPKEWEVLRINQVSTLVTNGFVGVATPYYATSDNGIKYLYGTNIRANEITFDDIRYVNKSFHQKQMKSQLKAGDMLTVQSGHIGTSAVIPESFGDANCHALIITRFVLSEIFPWFTSYYLNSNIGMKGMEKLFIGSTIKHINTSELAKHQIIKPRIEEQESISKRLDSIETLIRIEVQNLNKNQYLKQALMSDLLTGRIRVNYEEDELKEAV